MYPCAWGLWGEGGRPCFWDCMYPKRGSEPHCLLQCLPIIGEITSRASCRHGWRASYTWATIIDRACISVNITGGGTTGNKKAGSHLLWGHDHATELPELNQFVIEWLERCIATPRSSVVPQAKYAGPLCWHCTSRGKENRYAQNARTPCLLQQKKIRLQCDRMGLKGVSAKIRWLSFVLASDPQVVKNAGVWGVGFGGDAVPQ